MLNLCQETLLYPTKERLKYCDVNDIYLNDNCVVNVRFV